MGGEKPGLWARGNPGLFSGEGKPHGFRLAIACSERPLDRRRSKGKGGGREILGVKIPLTWHEERKILQDLPSNSLRGECVEEKPRIGKRVNRRVNGAEAVPPLGDKEGEAVD